MIKEIYQKFEREKSVLKQKNEFLNEELKEIRQKCYQAQEVQEILLKNFDSNVISFFILYNLEFYILLNY